MRLGLGLGIGAGGSAQSEPADTRPKVWISSDIFGAGEKDDIQSFLSMIPYLNQINLMGFSCCLPGGSTQVAAVQNLITQVSADIAAYKALDDSYPSAAELAALIAQGKLSAAGAPGDGLNTAGSDALISAAHTSSPSDPLWVLIWGTYGDLAQALYDDPTILPNIRVYGIAATTGFNYTTDAGAANYLINNMVPGQPLDDLWFIANDSSFRGMYCGSGGENTPQRDWPWEHAVGRGEIGDAFVDACLDLYGDGTTSGLKMGDTPSLLYVLDNVLVQGTGDDPAAAGGGWGGRFEKDAAKGNNYWKDVQSGQTLGSFVGANTVYLHQADILADMAAKFALIANPTIYTGETFSNLTVTDTTIAGRVSVPFGETWTNYRTDRPMNAVNAGEMDYVTSAGSSTSLHYLANTMPGVDYTVEGAMLFTSASALPGLLMNVSGSLSGGDGQFYQILMDSAAPYNWTIGKDFASSGVAITSNTAAQASTITVGINTPFRMKMRREGAVITMWVRLVSGGGWVQCLQWTDASPLIGAGNAGVRGINTARIYAFVARSNA